MQFNSYLFLLLYFPVFIFGYFLLNKISVTGGKIYMLIASIFFYLYGGRDIAVILGISICINYVFSIILSRLTRWNRIVLAVAIVSDVSFLFYFKYFNFFLGNINAILGQVCTLKEIVLPLGISFFTFQQIMYLADVYHKEIKRVNMLDYLMYILYFPKIIMGPLAEPQKLILQFNDLERKRINWDNISYGLKTFSFGFFKKMVLADTFAAAVSWGYSNIDTSTAMDWFVVMLSYTFQIYFDFSGYSDMAVGISEMLNIELPVNFDSPYKALSIRDFWKRWHISLTAFLTKYVYIPLGGSRKGTGRTYINTLIVFLVSGIWHGANWTFILWGAFHGIFCVLDRIFEKAKKNLMETVQWCCTFLVINILWLLFRSETIGQWWNLLKRMFSFQDMAVSDGMLNAFCLPETSFIFHILRLEQISSEVRGFSLLLFMLCAYGICLIPKNNYRNRNSNNWITMVLSAIAFVWSFLCLSSETVFVYFNF